MASCRRIGLGVAGQYSEKTQNNNGNSISYYLTSKCVNYRTTETTSRCNYNSNAIASIVNNRMRKYRVEIWRFQNCTSKTLLLVRIYYTGAGRLPRVLVFYSGNRVFCNFIYLINKSSNGLGWRLVREMTRATNLIHSYGV